MSVATKTAGCNMKSPSPIVVVDIYANQNPSLNPTSLPVVPNRSAFQPA